VASAIASTATRGRALKADGKGQITTGATALSTGRPRGTIDLMWNEIFKRWIDLLFWWVPKGEAKPPEAKERAPSATEEGARHEPEVAPQVVSDDLTAIRGIGPAIREKLRALGIATFIDLARADPKALTERLKGAQPISEARVRGWIEAARQRAKA
jgi:predicted flap endonuclease-1-like 5' DNA nuclease